MKPVITLLTLGVADMPRARAFYAAMGWQEAAGSSDDVAFLHGAGAKLALWSRPSLAEDSGVADDHGGWGGITLAHNVGSPAEVDAVLAEAEKAGARVVRAGAPTFWGGYSGLFADQDGHRWEVAHNPFWGLDEVGHAILPS